MSGFDILSRRDNLRSYRVRLRNEIARQEQLIRWRSGDPIDGQRRLEGLRMQLRSTEREWSELEAMLGRPHPIRPVKIGTPARTQPVRLRAPTRRTSSGYITKVMLPD